MRRAAVLTVITLIVLHAAGVHAESPPGSGMNRSNGIILNGEIIANEISKATGCAISPILGISVLGAYTYYTTAPEDRDHVPWHARPEFWVPLFIVLLGIIIKDTSKIALPKIIVMPLDAIETLLEKNTSAVLGLLIILSSITGKGLDQLRLTGHSITFSLLPSAFAGESIHSTAAAGASGIIELGILSCLVITVYTVVWVVSQSFNFLMFLCPFSWIDLLLLMIKNSIIAMLFGSYLMNPYLGLGVAIVIITIAFFLFSRSFRFLVFGTILTADTLLKRSGKHTFDSDTVSVFAGSGIPDVPSLSYGVLQNNNTFLEFTFRPWLILPSRTINTGIPGSSCDIGIGSISPVIIKPGKKGNAYATIFRLRPLYTSHEEKVAETLGLAAIRDVTIGKTIREGFRWLSDLFGQPETKKIDPA